MSDDKKKFSFAKTEEKKEVKKSEPKVKVGDKKGDYTVLTVLEDGRLVVSSSTEAKVIKASEF
jgi:hypothetical protein